MPNGNGTGPAGMGPMTGRGAGYCAGNQAPGFVNPAPGRGYNSGFGRGMGLGFRGGRGGRWAQPNFGYPMQNAGAYNSPPTRQQEVEALHQQAKYLESAISDITQRISELEV